MTHAKTPPPQGNYRPAMRHRDMVYTSGMTPRRDGVLLYQGRIGVSEPLEMHRDAVELAARNALSAAVSVLDPDECIAAILHMQVFINAEAGFANHPKLADFASAFLAQELGEPGIGSRAAVGVGSLPSNAPVEITLCASIGLRDDLSRDEPVIHR